MRCPFAEWRGPIYGNTPGGMEAVVGVVFHIMGSTFSAADNWFHSPGSGDPNRGAGAHFGIKQNGDVVQWADTADRAWHAMAANRHWIGVETEGVGGPLSDVGIATFGRLYRWLHDTHGVPFQITDDPNNGHGLGWHGMGGAAWGGHNYCPGPERRAQRQLVINLAQGTQGDDLTPDQAQQLAEAHAVTTQLAKWFSDPFTPGEPNLFNSFIEDYRRLKKLEAEVDAIKAKLGA